MKKFLFLLASVATVAFLATSCSKDKEEGGDDPDLTTPIELTNVNIPAFTESMKGASVTIDGKGFLKKDKITLTPLSGGAAVTITPTEITAAKLVFKFPSDLATDVKGWTLTLKRGTQSKVIGTLEPVAENDPDLTTPIDIKDIVIPEFEESMKGQAVTIEGTGFLGKDKIKLVPVSGAAADSVVVRPDEITDAKLVFTFPSTMATDAKGWTLVLRRGIQSKDLGVLKPVDGDDPDLTTPIDLSNVSVPAFTESMKGNAVTINGEGFLGKDKISLKPRSGGAATEIKADEVTATKLVFTLPATLATDAKGWIMTLVRGTQTEEMACFRSTDGRFKVADEALRGYLKGLSNNNPYLFDAEGYAYPADADEVKFPVEGEGDDAQVKITLSGLPVTTLDGLEKFKDVANVKWAMFDGTKLKKIDMTIFPACLRLQAWGDGSEGAAPGTIEEVNFGAVGVNSPSALRYVQLERNSIKRLDVTNIAVLCELKVENNPLEFLDIRNMMPDGNGYMYIWKKPNHQSVNFKFTSDTSKERTLRVERYWWRCVSQANLDTVGAEVSWVVDNPAIDALNDGVTVECYTYYGEKASDDPNNNYGADGGPQKLLHKHQKGGENPDMCNLYTGSLHP